MVSLRLVLKESFANHLKSSALRAELLNGAANHLKTDKYDHTNSSKERRRKTQIVPDNCSTYNFSTL